MEWPAVKLPSRRWARIISPLVVMVLLGTTGLLIVIIASHKPPAAVTPQMPLIRFCASGNRPAAPASHPPEITYIGTDGNVWDMQWPDGPPRQFTSDALRASKSNGYNEVIYSGLAWSPDGTRLAVLRIAGPIASVNETTDLLLFSPEGKIMLRAPLGALEEYIDNIAWSPDGCALAYPYHGDPGQGDLVILDAATGKTIKTVIYNFHHYLVCDPGPYPLGNTLYFLTFDTFAWSPDEQSILIWYDCGTGASGRVDLDSGDATPNYPEDATYRPGTNQHQEVILGQWYTGSDTDARPVLGLTDADGNQIRTLVTGPQDNSYPPLYANDLGRGAWTSDGQAIYYEYEDGIWRINADGSGARMIVAGTPLDSQENATVEVVPTPSPDGRMLLYMQLQGNNRSQGFPSGQWYVAQANGTNPVPLPQATLGSDYAPIEAIWRPET